MEQSLPKSDSFEFKLKILEKELESINEIIERHDKFTQTTKNWAIVLWIGVLSLILKDNKQLSHFIFLTPVIPLIFWIVDATWRRLQNRSIYRSQKISEYLNSDDLEKAFSEKDFGEFVIWDVTGNQYNNEDDYKRFCSLWRSLRFGSVMRFYIAMIFLSLLIGVCFQLMK